MSASEHTRKFRPQPCQSITIRWKTVKCASRKSTGNSFSNAWPSSCCFDNRTHLPREAPPDRDGSPVPASARRAPHAILSQSVQRSASAASDRRWVVLPLHA